jgi:hypothetical protein
MTFILRQTTAVNIPMGPFIDPAARTAETGMTITQAETFLSKNGGVEAAKNEGTNATEIGNGMYSIILDTVDTTTIGTLAIYVNDSQASPMAVECQIIEQAIYDALYVNLAAGFSALGEVSLVAATQASIDATETAAVLTQSEWADGGRLDLLLDGVVAAVDTALSEPIKGNIDHTIKLAAKVSMIYKLLLNRREQTAILQEVYNSDESTVDHQAIISSDGTTLVFGEMKTGP